MVTGSILLLFTMIYAVLSLIPQKTNPAIKEINQLPTMTMNHQEIQNYLEQTKGINDEVTKYFNYVYSSLNEGTWSKKAEFDLQTKFIEFDKKIETNIIYLIPLKNYYKKQINLERKIISLEKEKKSIKRLMNAIKIRELKKKYNKNITNEINIIMTLFKKAGINYELRKDGSLYYEIIEKK